MTETVEIRLKTFDRHFRFFKFGKITNISDIFKQENRNVWFRPFGRNSKILVLVEISETSDSLELYLQKQD